MITAPRDHGGGLDAAIANYGGTRQSWLDLSTGIIGASRKRRRFWPPPVRRP